MGEPVSRTRRRVGSAHHARGSELHRDDEGGHADHTPGASEARECAAMAGLLIVRTKPLKDLGSRIGEMWTQTEEGDRP